AVEWMENKSSDLIGKKCCIDSNLEKERERSQKAAPNQIERVSVSVRVINKSCKRVNKNKKSLMRKERRKESNKFKLVKINSFLQMSRTGVRTQPDSKGRQKEGKTDDCRWEGNMRN